MKINTKLGLLTLCLISLGATNAVAQHAAHDMDHRSPAKLVQDVRAATQQYLNVNNATSAGYGALFGCISGSDHGAMGIHYLNGRLLNGTIDVKTPQALIYEPQPDGGLTLVGVEYIVDMATWLKSNSGPPVLDGQVFTLIDAPNRYTVPAPFFELHVWAWRDNPQGSFVDWNNHVSCDAGQ